MKRKATAHVLRLIVIGALTTSAFAQQAEPAMEPHILQLTPEELAKEPGSVSKPTTAAVPAKQCRVNFNCSSSVRMCYFSIFYSTGGIRNFTLWGGSSDVISGLRYGDQYCVDTAGVPSASCRRITIPREHFSC